MAVEKVYMHRLGKVFAGVWEAPQKLQVACVL